MKFAHAWAFPDADEQMMREMAPDGSYQRSHLEAALRHVQDFSLAIDGGAHIGTWTRPMASRFAAVIAVEPSPDTFDALRCNCEGLAHVTLRRIGLGARAGRGQLEIDGKALALKNTGARYVVPNPLGQVVIEAIDSWALPSLGFLKLDIEGSEVAALRGALETIRRCQPIVLYENKGFWKKRYHEAPDAPAVLLSQVHYRLYETVVRDEIWGPR